MVSRFFSRYPLVTSLCLASLFIGQNSQAQSLDHQQEETQGSIVSSKTKCDLEFENKVRQEAWREENEDCAFENWYITAAFGFASGDYSTGDVADAAQNLGFDVFDIEVDDSRIAGKVAVGVSLTDNIALELGYLDLGEVDAAFSTETDDPDSFFALTNTIHPTSTKGYAVSGIYQFMQKEDWFLQVRLGVLFWNGDYNSLDVFGDRPVPNNSDTDGKDYFFGAGGNYQLDEELQLILEWERYRVDTENTDLLSIGLTYHF